MQMQRMFGMISLLSVGFLAGCGASPEAQGSQARDPVADADDAPIDGVALLDAELAKAGGIGTARFPLMTDDANWVTFIDGYNNAVTDSTAPAGGTATPGSPIAAGEGLCRAFARDNSAIDDTDGKTGELVAQAGRLEGNKCWIEWMNKRYYYVMPNNYAQYLVAKPRTWRSMARQLPAPNVVANGLVVDYHNHDRSKPIYACEMYRDQGDYKWFAGKYVEGNCYVAVSGAIYKTAPSEYDSLRILMNN